MSAPVDVLAVMEHFVNNGTTSRDRINAERARAAVAELIDAVQRVDEVLVDRKGHEFLEAYGFTFHNLQRALARVKGGAA